MNTWLGWRTEIIGELGVAKAAGSADECRVRVRTLVCFLGAWWLALTVPVRAADPRPVVGPGATKDEVIDAYGWPNGSSQSGAKEILTYTQGQVMLENGRVERVDFSMHIPWPAPRPRPGPATPTTVKKPEPVVDFWLTDFAEAQREAVRRRSRILALFTGSDWSPASKQFHDEIELHPDFVNTFTGNFVFVRLDFAARTPIPAEIREQNNRLRERYGVTIYPSLLVLSPSGTVAAVVDLTKEQPGENYRARVISAVREVRDLLLQRPLEPAPAPESATAPPGAADTPPSKSGASESSVALISSLLSARWLIYSGVGMGVVIVVVLLWMVWRNGTSSAKPEGRFTMADRISDAAGGLPSAAELGEWPRTKIAALVAALAESDGYVAELQPGSLDKDIVLKRAGETEPCVLVCCAGGDTGLVPAKRVRELFGTLTAEGVAVGWYVSPIGFSADARAFAHQHNLLLIDCEWMLARLRDLPPLMVPRVLMRIAGGRK